MSTEAGSLISSIYDTAINPDLWDAALDNCVKHVGCRSSTLIILDDDAVSGLRLDKVSEVFRQTPKPIVEYYQRNLIHYEKEGWENVLRHPKQTLLTDKDSWPQEDSEYIHRADIAYLMKHFGVLRRVVAKLNDSTAWFDVVAFQFDKSLSIVPPRQMGLIQELLPHLAKASELCRCFNILQTRYKAVLNALDHVEVGLCIALGNGSIIVANAEADRLLDMADGIRLHHNGRLLCRDNELQGALSQAISTTSSTASGSNSSAEILLSITRPSGRRAFLVEVSPLSDSNGELQVNLRGSLIMIVDPENSAPLQISRLAKTSGLTAAETEVAQYLVHGWINSEIAEQRGVSLQTIKSQVASILQKTGTRRRSELIRLALKTSPPIKSINSWTEGSPD